MGADRDCPEPQMAMKTQSFNALTLPAPLSLTGSGLVAAGTMLPWFSFFAGLHPVRGIAGINGQLLLAAGLVLVLASGASLLLQKPALRRGIGWAGVVLSGVLGVLLIRMFEAKEQLSANPMMVARLGPGLFVSLAGAVLVAATLLLPARRSHQAM